MTRQRRGVVQRIQFWPWHPLLFAVVPVLFLFANNVEYIPADQLAVPMGVSLVFAAITWAVAALFLQSWKHAALVATPLALATQTYGTFYEVIASNVQRGTANHAILLGASSATVLVVLIAWTGVVAWQRRRRTFDAFTSALNAAGAFLIVLNAGIVLAGSAPAPAASGPRPSGTPRSVFTLVVDQYASSEEMTAAYGVYDSALEGYLENHGFRIARNASTGFSNTAQSLDAFLNMNPAGSGTVAARRSSGIRLAREIGLTFGEATPRCHGIRQNKVLARFRDAGYYTVNIGSWFDCTRYNRLADENVNTYGWQFRDELNALTVQASLVRLAWTGDNEGLRRGIDRQFAAFSEDRSASSPTYVFAHLISPHPPYVFDRDGHEPASGATPAELYRQQHEYISWKIQEAVDAILSRPGPQPIITVQSDHGGKIDVNSPFATQVFSAILLPEDLDSAWRDDLQLADTFKIVFAYLGFDE